jgi:hypothetical protein
MVTQNWRRLKLNTRESTMYDFSKYIKKVKRLVAIWEKEKAQNSH